MGGAKQFRLTIGALIAALSLSACQVMNSSQSYGLLDDGTVAQTCASGLGSYALPYSTINVIVSQLYLVKTNEPFGGSLFSLGTVVQHPDPKHRYCLDFLESVASDDTVGVYYGESQKDSSTKSDTTAVALNTLEPTGPARNSSGLLSLVVSKNVDQTGEAILRLLRAIFIFISRNPDFDLDRAETPPPETTARVITDQDVDPFNLQAMANLNMDIRKYGLCVTMGKYTHGETMSPDDYCNNPKRALEGDGLPIDTIIAKKQRRLTNKKPTGVLYRPRQNYSLFVYGKDDPQIERKWKLLQVETVALENLSPVMSIEVKRAMFAEHRVALAFDNGNLIDVCLAKGSELAGAIKIPVNVVFGLVSLPSQTIEAELNRLSNKAKLLEAQKKVIVAQEDYISQIKQSSGAGNVNSFDEIPLALGRDNAFTKRDTSGVTSTFDEIKSDSKIPRGFCQLIAGKD